MKTNDTYIVIGGCGYLGCNVAKFLSQQGAKLRCLVMKGEDTTPIQDTNAEIFVGDILDKASLSDIFTCDSQINVIHTAGIVSTQSKMDERLWATNVIGVQNVVDMCILTNARLVYVSSVDAIEVSDDYSVVITEPDSFYPDKVVTAYGKTKAAATDIVLNAALAGLSANVVMPTAVIGPNDYKHGMVSTLLSMYSKKHTFPLVKGGYDFIDVRDLAPTIVNAFETERFGETYIVSNVYTSFLDIVNIARKWLGYKPVKMMLPNWMACTAGNAVEFTGRITKNTPLFTAYLVELANSGKKYDNAKARLKLGLKPRSVAESVEDTVSFLCDNGQIKKNTQYAKIKEKH